MDTPPFYEPPLRRAFGPSAPQHRKRRRAALAVGAAVVVACCTSLVLYLRLDGTAKRGSVVSFALLILPARLCAFAFACTFTGLALNQYAWYTTRTYHDCFHDEQGPVWMIVTFAASLVAAVTFVVSIVSPSSWLLAGCCCSPSPPGYCVVASLALRRTRRAIRRERVINVSIGHVGFRDGDVERPSPINS